MSALQYNVSQLLKSDVGSTRVYEFTTNLPLDIDDGVAHDINGIVKFTLTNFGIIAAVEAHAILDLTCARCLEPLSMPMTLQFEDEYQPMIDIATGLPSTAPRSDAAFNISQSHTIDLIEAIRENLVLSIEMAPLCDRACKGLCPTCGSNLNTGQCACPPPENTSPFAVLQGLISVQEVEK